MVNKKPGFHFSFGSAFALIGLALATTSGNVQAQAFTHADSGWVSLFNGKDWTGIYSRNWGTNQQKMHPPGAPWQIVNPGTDTATIRVSATTPGGNIGTDDSTFSHYRMRVDQKFDVLGGDLNGGLTYHTNESTSLSRMMNNWPRSIEFQMQQREPGSAYSIQQLTFTTRVNGNRYAPTGGTVVQACETGCNGRNYVSNPTPAEAGSDGKPRWLHFELVTRGSDTAYHIINDTLVFKLWNIRVFNDNANKTPDGPVDHGGLALQSEGAVINYRHWEVMKFPKETPMNENYLHRLFLDNPDQGASLKANATYTVKWRTLGSTGQTGSIPTVNLQYSIGGGAWQTLASNVPNTGSYDWKVPEQTTDQLKVKVSAANWVWADSSSGNNAIQPTTGILPVGFKHLNLSVEGQGMVWTAIEAYSEVRIHDAFGRVVRSYPIHGHSIAWDWTNAAGQPVQPGIYFLRALGQGKSLTARVLKY